MNISIGMVGDGGTKWQSIDAREQDTRVKEEVAEWRQNSEEYSWQDFEDMFEDRDPLEFL